MGITVGIKVSIKVRDIIEQADDEPRELLEVFLAAELSVEEHHKVAGVGLSRSGLEGDVRLYAVIGSSLQQELDLSDFGD